ncbi:hypothetical protein HZQ19_09595 [Elizabethkingia anophelis]|uniref:hypothetical protein n=1 Tax=Elizabethkingia anophelis TaxID=1117645 RepID=UPI000C9AA08D|nr:hypothetical protein [Elizabethkingia anophelis]MCT3757740.1 hypothetical protein [Elizabethkingia anophelis]MCT3973359.1 hypothetical protein [Elizabethkingia anophelis]MCT4002122.1 hypothetical protein [Elizabethkingia anophelis]MCT4016315.1 hypothetical protein [Elizabethkingia anophelis]MCT4019703.1 hypothetical protein [Elizabethkingia anophelis]
MKTTYLKQLKTIDNEYLLERLNICDFEHYIQADEFQYVFDHIFNIFNAESQKYNIRKPIFVYTESDSLNACAIKSNDFNIVSFNKGLILISINEILDNDKLQEFNNSFKSTSEFLNIKIERLIFQFTMLFTFYHEFGHLLQNTNEELNMSEANQENTNDVKNSHYKELDADAYSAVHLARHINEYCVKSFPPDILKECIIGITAIFCSNLLFHLLRFPSSKRDLYFEENTHPHAYIRILNIIANIVRYINSDANLLERNVHITKKDLLKPIVDEVYRLESIYDSSLHNFKDCVINEIENITKYITKISKNKPSDLNSALDFYNSKI